MASAQSPDQSTPPPPPTPPSGTVLHTGTQLVVVDVVVQDKQGRPIHGLTRDNFRVLEDRNQQTVRAFDEHSTAPPATAQAPLKLPPRTFTNFSTLKPGGALNVLLVDALNTPLIDQTYLHDQLKRYVDHATPGSRVAIFGLNQNLYMLQGFTSDPELLKNAVNQKLKTRPSQLLDDVSGANQETTSITAETSAAGGGGIALGSGNWAAALAVFEADNATQQTVNRNQITLAGLSQLGRYLAAFPGRKNIIWLSSSFPNNIVLDPTTGQDQILLSAADDMRRTTELLIRAQVALYPVDVRGVTTETMFDSSQSGSKYAAHGSNSTAMTNDVRDFVSGESSAHRNMDEIAADTGGRAFYNDNDFARIVNGVIETGSNYYTLTYNPPPRVPRGEFHRIAVQLAGIDASGTHLYYRHNYYAEPGPTANVTTASAGNFADIPSARAAQTYSRQSMARGAPEPQDVIFTVHAAPLADAPAAQPVSTNKLNPDGSFKGPYRTFNLDFAIGAQRLNLPLGKDGKRHGEVEFAVFVYNKDGKLLASQGQTIKLGITPDIYNQLLRTGVQMRQQVSTPVRGNFILRAGVHDVTNGNIGALEIDGTAVRPSPSEASTIAAPDSLH